MNALIRKEIRALLPAWLATLLLAVVPTCLYAIKARSFWSDNAFAAQQGFIILSGYCFGLGAVVLALTPFGHEFTAKTFSHLLSQPATRQRMWIAKALPLAVATLLNLIVYLGSLWLVLHWFGVTWDFLADIQDMFRTIPIVALLAYSGGLWTTVLFRTIPGALGITIVAPLAVLMLENRIVGKIAPYYVDTLAPWFLVVYAIAGIIFARWYFLRAQDVPWEGRAISFPTGRPNFWRLLSAVRRTSKYVALVHKELQLHQTSFFIAAFLLIAHLGSFVVRKFMPQSNASETWIIINNIWTVWFVLPLFIGSTPVAEERRLGTLESLLTQPIPRRAQFLIKFLITAALAILFGAIVPWILEHGWNHFGPHNELMFETSFDGLLATAIVIASCTFFASTISRQTIEALCLGAVLTPIAYVIVQFLASIKVGGDAPRYGLLTYPIFASIVLSTVVYLAWKNYQRAHLRWTILVATFGVLALSVLTAWGIASFTWHRTWEFVVPMEPKHGPAKMHIGDGAKIVSTMHGAMVLLPDHRLWLAHVKLEVAYDKEKPKEDHVVGAHLERSRFLAGTWQDIAEAAGHAPYGIKIDGTLWEFRSVKTDNYLPVLGEKEFEADMPRQIGTDTDWASLTSGVNYMYALKRDGSLWGWSRGGHRRDNAQYYVQTDYVFRRIWPDVKWSKVFASDDVCLGIKDDGTVWKWQTSNGVLERSEFTGTNWTSFGDDFGVNLATRDDGTLWSSVKGDARKSGYVSRLSIIFGDTFDTGPGLHRVGDSTNWNFITSFYPRCALKSNGTWLIHNFQVLRESRHKGVRVSSYSDWVAIDSKYAHIIGLAADGTVSEWMLTDSYPYYTGRTRAPTWSTNVFAAQ